jgi:regulator of RNase E activity RraA
MPEQKAAPGAGLPKPNLQLPIRGGDVPRPDAELIRAMHGVGSATASAVLHKIGVRQSFIQGPIARRPGAKIVGTALTLQFMPQREDIASGLNQEHGEKLSALWAVLETVQPGDVLTVQAYGDPYTGCFGEMLITYYKGRGGAGIVVDGCIRDWPRVQQIGLPIWTTGFTPNYASQSTLFPWAYNVPISCSRVLILPGDIIIADDDGAVCVPVQLAPMILKQTLEHEDWESFSRIRLAEGGALSRYYPLDEEGRKEYEVWRRRQPS